MDFPRTMAETHPMLDKIDAFCAIFAQHAEAVDVGGPANNRFRSNIVLLAESGFFGAGISTQFGGLELPARVQRQCVERISAACGVTAFGQNQLHTGGSFVSGADDDVKRELLPKLSSGEVLCGVAFAHVRRPSGSPVIARRVGDGYIVKGTAPWISDWSILTSFVLGAAVKETGEVLYCYVDRKSDSANLSPSPAMQLAVMTAADTVSVEINELFVPDRFVLQRHAAEQVPQRDLKNITTHVTLPLGCARGSVRYLRTLNFPLAIDGAARLQTEIDEVRECAEYWVGSRADEAGYMKNALKARVRAVTVALRAAETSIAASGGRAHLLTHPAQRRLREAGFYATMALTPDTQAALMEMFIND